MITNLRDAKEQLSDLVKRAANGEDIIITVRGQPMARLSSVLTTQSHNQDDFADELSQLAATVLNGAPALTDQDTWNQLRQDRF